MAGISGQHNAAFSDVVKVVEEHFLGAKRKFTVRRAETLFFSPVDHYESLEIQGLLDGINDVTIVVNLEWMGEDAKARYMVSECTEVKRAEFHRPLTGSEVEIGSLSSEKISEQESQKEQEEEPTKKPSFSGSIQQSQLNHLKALRIRKTHSLTDEELKKLTFDQANEMIERCTKALKKE